MKKNVVVRIEQAYEVTLRALARWYDGRTIEIFGGVREDGGAEYGVYIVSNLNDIDGFCAQLDALDDVTYKMYEDSD